MDQVEFNSKETGSLYASNVVLKVTEKWFKCSQEDCTCTRNAKDNFWMKSMKILHITGKLI